MCVLYCDVSALLHVCTVLDVSALLHVCTVLDVSAPLYAIIPCSNNEDIHFDVS